jgi:hypothetical protein
MKSRILRAIAAGLVIGTLLIAGTGVYASPGGRIAITIAGK